MGFLNSRWLKDKTRVFLMEAFQKSGFQVQIGTVEGNFPRQIELKKVSLEGKGLDLSIESMELHLSFWRLLRNEIAFTSVTGDGISWKKTEETPEEGEASPSPKKISFPLFVEHFQLTRVQLPDLFTCNLEGRLRIKETKSFLDISVSRPEFPESTARLLMVVKQDGAAQLKLKVKTPTLKALSLPENMFDTSLIMQVYAEGPFDSFWQGEGALVPIEGRALGQVEIVKVPTEAPFAKLLGEKGSFDINFLKGKEELTLSKISLKSALLNAKGRASLDPKFHLRQGTLQILSDSLLSLFDLSARGRLFGQLNLIAENGGYQTNISWHVPSLTWETLQMETVKGSIDALFVDQSLKGAASLSGLLSKGEWSGKTDFAWSLGDSLFLSDWNLFGPYLTGEGSLEVRTDGILAGTSAFQIGNFQSLPISGLKIYGSGHAKAHWTSIIQEGLPIQALTLDVTASDFYYGPLFSQTVSLYSDLLDPFKERIGIVDLQFEQAKWGELTLETLNLETTLGGENWPFQLTADGKWKHPLELRMGGSVRGDSTAGRIEVQNWTGSFFKHPFFLKNPVNVEWSPSLFRLKDLELIFSDASIFGSFDQENEQTDAKLQFNNLPLDFLSLNPLDLSISGRINLDSSLREKNHQLKGNLKASIAQMEVDALGTNEQLEAQGKIEGSFNRDRLDLKGNLEVRGEPLFDLDLSLPIHLSLAPFEATILPHKNVKGQISLKGRIEDFLDFFDLGTHRLEGECICDLKLKNTLYRPEVDGYCHFTDGFYQNYYTGTELRNIAAEWVANEKTILLTSLTAQDAPKNGNFTAVGRIDLIPEALYPFHFDVEFSNLNFVQIDLVSAVANGKIHIEGNKLSATAHGDVGVTQGDMMIPDHIPRPLPNLQVVYKNAIRPLEGMEEPKKKPSIPYPLFLNLHVTAPDGILIHGRGLNSEWKGDFQVGGQYTSISAKGKLELLKGEFSFSSRTFKLSEGSLSLSGKEHEMPYLNLSGSMMQKGIAITAHLKGPLNSPQLTFQSVPPLPMGSIMSYLLFGQDLSEISGFQALQLATSLASLSGEGPDVMESTRRSLGVDRLRIISSPSTTEEGEDTIALQVGKYVAEGVIISYSQGAEDDSANISLEVEIKDNFVFQAESQQQQEQGKFTLKWNLNY
ncbi:MAG: translocation/assembly module TamB domain-containing protein [Chlamydiota bacterium]